MIWSRVLLYSSLCFCFFFKQKTAYELLISDWSSDVCSSDLTEGDSVGAHTISARPSRGASALAEAHDVASRLPAPPGSIGGVSRGVSRGAQTGRASRRERVCQSG